MFVRVVRDRLNRERSFGKAVWQAAMAPMFGVDSILRLNSSTANRKGSTASCNSPLKVIV